MDKWIFLIVGGIVGTGSRFWMAAAVSQKLGNGFPWGTLAVNVVGCFVVGFFDVLFAKKFLLSPNHRVLLMTGFCGAFTTFSALILETSDLLKQNQYFHAFGNLFLSILVGFLAFKVGSVLAELL